MEYTFDPVTNRKQIDELHDWAASVQSIGAHTYKLVSINADQLSITEYVSRPCWGEIRPYAKTHPEEVKDGVTMPGDLHIRFPDGNPVALAIALRTNAAPHPEYHNEWRKFIFSEESPWKSVMKGLEIRTDDKGFLKSIVFLNTRVDPTVLVHALKESRGHPRKDLTDKGASFTEAYFLSHQIAWGYGIADGCLVQSFGDYMLTINSSMTRVFNGKPLELSVNANTLFERGVYNRPKIESVFCDGKDSLPKLEWFQKNRNTKVPTNVIVNELIPEMRKYVNETNSDSRG